MAVQQRNEDVTNDWWALGQEATVIKDQSETKSAGVSPLSTPFFPSSIPLSFRLIVIQDLPKTSLGDLQFYWIDALEDILSFVLSLSLLLLPPSSV